MIRALTVFITFLLINLLSSSLVLAERVYLDITASDVRKVVVAIPDFTQKSVPGPVSLKGKEMSRLLSQALDFHGFVDIIDSKKYGGGQKNDFLSARGG